MAASHNQRSNSGLREVQVIYIFNSQSTGIYLHINRDTRGFFQLLWNHHKCLSWFFPLIWIPVLSWLWLYGHYMGGGPRVVVSTAAFHARVWGSVSGLGGLKETKKNLPHPRVKVSIVGSLRDREVACSASDRQGSNFESCVWRTVSSQSSHHPQEVLLAQFSLYVHKGGLKPD